MDQPTPVVPPALAAHALIAAARMLTSRLDVQAASLAVLDAAQSVFGASSSWVLLHEPRENQLRTVAFRGASAEAFRDVTIPATAGIMGLAFKSRQVVFVPNAQEDGRWFDVTRIQHTGLRSALAVPLVVQDRTIGVIGMDTPRYGPERPPQPGDIALFEAMAAQAAIAIANAQLYEASERDRRRLAALLGERRSLRRRVTHLQEEVRAAHADCIGESASWHEVVKLADLVAAGDTTVLLLGETGTGKELLARRIHAESLRAAGPFVAVNCAALPESLVESELFGHEKGAFTNAVARKLGKFELADGGTLFLDEVGDLPGAAQAKLLRVLQDSKVERVGSSAPVPVNVRVIAATNQDLEVSIANKTYRSDLFFRLSVFPLRLPTLRDRATDIPLLARHFLRVSSSRLRRPATDLADEALQRLVMYPWPGNVRELQNVMERAAILTTGEIVPLDAIWLPNVSVPPRDAGEAVGMPTLVEAERRAILVALEAAAWRISGKGGAADRLDMKPTTLHAKMKKLGIRRPARG
jgi:formate hydrogenlyase transcriptional activator